MLVTTTAINNDVGPVTIALAAGRIRRVRMLGICQLSSTAAGVRLITAQNIRTDSGVTVTMGFGNQATAGTIVYQFTPNDGLDVAMDQPSTFTFAAGTNTGTYTCVVGYDRV